MNVFEVYLNVKTLMCVRTKKEDMIAYAPKIW